MKLSITTYAFFILVLTNIIAHHFDPSFRAIHQSILDFCTCYGLYVMHKIVE